MPEHDSIAVKIAQYLLEIKAVKLQPNEPFTWASGWKSPIYSDNRITLSYPQIRTFIKEEMVKRINQQYAQADVIIGVATAGIPQGALIADAMNLPFGYVRSSAKKHGMGNQIEGDVKPGQKAVVIEDLISTGKSSLSAVHALRDSGVEVLGLAAIFTYGFDLASENFKTANCPFFTLSDYDTLLQAAIQTGTVAHNSLELLSQWRQAPEKWLV